jgi:hypothetical protein
MDSRIECGKSARLAARAVLMYCRSIAGYELHEHCVIL